jgi:hypothetical protein
MCSALGFCVGRLLLAHLTTATQRKWGPIGVDRFYNLCTLCYFCGGASAGYLQHNNASFFRYVPNFVVQFGISRCVCAAAAAAAAAANA